MILPTFTRTVRDHLLLESGDRVLAAVSGGGDSVALLVLLMRYARDVPLTIHVAHVNHRLRAEASDQDEAFVRDLARQFGLPFVALSPDPERAESSRGRSEESARRLRHRLLSAAATASRCGRIVLAHTMDDQAETVLMRLMRGAGRRGLSGMSYAGPGKLVRPMLDITRDQARAFLSEIGQEYREDASNQDQRFLRNRIRADLIPVMARYNPAIKTILARTAGLLREEDLFLDHLASEILARHLVAAPAGRVKALGTSAEMVVPAAVLNGAAPPLARRIARQILARVGADPRGARLTAVEDLLALAAGSGTSDRREAAGGILLKREGVYLCVGGPRGLEDLPRLTSFSVPLAIPGRADLTSIGGVLEARLVPGGQVETAQTGPDIVYLDAGLLGPVATVRSRLPGDVFHPLGAPGRRKLKRFLIDSKIPRRTRDMIPLVVGPAGIAWVVGGRIAHPYRLTEATRQVAELRYMRRVDLRGAHV